MLLEKHGRPPKLEEGCQASYMIDSNKYIVTGGVKQPFNIQDMQQVQEQPQQETSNAISFKIGGSKPGLSLAKGLGTNAAQNQEQYVYLFEPGNYQWEINQTSGRIPTRRVFHHVWYEAPYLFIYGGQTLDSKILSDTYMLNTETFQWKRFFYLEGPPPRIHSGFCSTGGASMPENLLLNDIWFFSLENVAWESPSLELPGIIWQKVEVKKGAALLPTLKGHSVIQVTESQIFIFGGFNQNKQTLDIALLFDMGSQTLKPFQTKGSKPSPRAFHKVMMVKENLLCLFGGVNGPEDQLKPSHYLNDLYLLNIVEGFWSTPQVGGYIPGPRCFFAFTGNQNDVYGELIVLGGKVQEGTVDQCVYILHELDMDHREAWEERNDEEKNQFASYRDAVKTQQKGSLQNVTTLNLEFNEAEKIIVEQKRQMGEKERDLKKIQKDNDSYVEQTKQAQEKIDKTKLELETKLVQLQKEIVDKNMKSKEDQELIDKIKILLAYERKKRKILQKKANGLQDAFRKAENFIITMDQYYCRGLRGQAIILNQTYKDEAFSGNVSEDMLVRIEKLKFEHRNSLILFRTEFEGTYKREQHIRTQLKEKKTILNKFESLSKIYHSKLEKEDKEYLAL